MTLKEVIEEVIDERGLEAIPRIEYYTTVDIGDGHPVENFFTGVAAYEFG